MHWPCLSGQKKQQTGTENRWLLLKSATKISTHNLNQISNPKRRINRNKYPEAKGTLRFSGLVVNWCSGSCCSLWSPQNQTWAHEEEETERTIKSGSSFTQTTCDQQPSPVTTPFHTEHTLALIRSAESVQMTYKPRYIPTLLWAKFRRYVFRPWTHRLQAWRTISAAYPAGCFDVTQWKHTHTPTATNSWSHI